MGPYGHIYHHAMSERLPASLAYLLIYNPTLPAPNSASRDDEDAQEEAHILFYTSRERVVSRDRMLRQVGLAKALVNFSEYCSISHLIFVLVKVFDLRIFTPGQGCDTVHSQGKRMISVSPEPDFWMHVVCSFHVVVYLLVSKHNIVCRLGEDAETEQK